MLCFILYYVILYYRVYYIILYYIILYYIILYYITLYSIYYIRSTISMNLRLDTELNKRIGHYYLKGPVVAIERADFNTCACENLVDICQRDRTFHFKSFHPILKVVSFQLSLTLCVKSHFLQRNKCQYLHAWPPCKQALSGCFVLCIAYLNARTVPL